MTPLALCPTRTLRRRVLTPAGWTALDGYRWRDPEDGAVLGWPLAYSAMERRARRDGAA